MSLWLQFPSHIHTQNQHEEKLNIDLSFFLLLYCDVLYELRMRRVHENLWCIIVTQNIKNDKKEDKKMLKSKGYNNIFHITLTATTTTSTTTSTKQPPQEC